MAKSFEKYLNRNFRAVHVNGFSEFASSKKGFHLSDILIKKENEGVFRRRRPVLKKAGSMIDLGTESSAEIQNSLRKGLAGFESEDPIEDVMFGWTYQDSNAEETFASAGSLSGSILAGPLADVTAHFSHSRNLTVRFENLSTACVDKDKLVEYVTSEQWKPNVEDPRLDWPGPSCVGRGGRQLWVIHQILFASKLEVSSGASNSVGARVSTVSPGAPGADVSMSYEGSSVLNLTVGTNTKFPGKFMFAVRAIRFQFDSAGELLDKPLDDAGKHMPVLFACAVLLPNHPHSGYLPGKPLDYLGLYDDEAAQIRDLFLEKPPEDEEKGDWDVQRLSIEDNTNEA